MTERPALVADDASRAHVYLMPLPKIVHVDPNPFDKATFQGEADEYDLDNNLTKLKVENAIGWRRRARKKRSGLRLLGPMARFCWWGGGGSGDNEGSSMNVGPGWMTAKQSAGWAKGSRATRPLRHPRSARAGGRVRWGVERPPIVAKGRFAVWGYGWSVI